MGVPALLYSRSRAKNLHVAIVLMLLTKSRPSVEKFRQRTPSNMKRRQFRIDIATRNLDLSLFLFSSLSNSTFQACYGASPFAILKPGNDSYWFDPCSGLNLFFFPIYFICCHLLITLHPPLYFHFLPHPHRTMFSSMISNAFSKPRDTVHKKSHTSASWPKGLPTNTERLRG